MTDLPDCAWLDVAIHVVSDETGARAAVKVGGANPKNIYESDWPELIKTSCELLNTMGDASDARPMTREEVKAYREEDED